MFDIRTDLALEAHELASKNKQHTVDGVIFREEYKEGYKLTRVEIISPEGEKATGKPMGKYLTLDVGKIWERGSEEFNDICLAVAELINELTINSSSILFVGLGNTDITADALGPKTVQNIIVTRHLKDEAPDVFNKMEFCDISAFAPGVLSQTGIETSEAVRSIADRIKPSAVIVVDALASADMSRLGTVIQISNTGISPGSGVCNRRMPLNEQALGVPVIAIGVPTVMDAVTLAYGITGTEQSSERIHECENMFVTPKDCDKIISFMSRVIGYSINVAFHKKLGIDEVISILS